MHSKHYPELGETLYTETLENGLVIQVLPKRGFQRCYAMFATNYGGADRRFLHGGSWLETPAGVAHFLEHKMFDMPDGNNALSVLSANGASPNAYTSSSMTAYYFDCTQGFQENLRQLLTFVSTPYFTPESVAKEQGIIGQEIRMCEDNPGYALYYNLLKCLYEKNPLRDSVAGTVESIAEITPETLYACHKVFYHPSNMRLCCVGDVDPKAISLLAKEILTREPGQSPGRDYGSAEPGKPFSTRSETQMEVSAPQFLFGLKLQPATPGPDRLRQALVGELALRYLMGESSPFYNQLYAKNLLNTDFAADLDYVANAAMVVGGGESRDPDAVMAALWEQVDAVRKGMDETYFQRLRKASIGSHLRGLDRLGGLCSAMVSGGFSGWCPLDSISALQSVTMQDVQETLLDWFQKENAAISIIKPVRG